MISWPDEWLVEDAKIAAYLLNVDHPDARAKARAFLKAGFDPDEPDKLALALLGHAKTSPHRKMPSDHGTCFVFEGPLAAPKTIIARLRSVWLMGPEARVARLVTAYPFDERKALVGTLRK